MAAGRTARAGLRRRARVYLALAALAIVVGLVGLSGGSGRGPMTFRLSGQLYTATSRQAALTSQQQAAITGTLTGSDGAQLLLYPGASGTLALTVHNPNNQTITVNQLAVAVGSPVPGCQGSNLSIGPFAGPLVVGASSSSTAMLPLVMAGSAPDACKDVSFPLTFAASGTGVDPPTTAPPTSAVAPAAAHTSAIAPTTAIAPPTVAPPTSLAQPVPAVTPPPTTQPLAGSAPGLTTAATTSGSVPGAATTAPSAPAATTPLRTPGAIVVPAALSPAKRPIPGTAFGLVADHLPATCHTVYFFFDSSRIGSGHPDRTGHFAEGGLVIPGDATSGVHTLSTSCSSSGRPALSSSAVTITQTPVHVSALVTAIPSPSKIDLSTKAATKSGLGILVLLLVMSFSCEVFNVVFEENYGAIRGWFGLKSEPKAPTEMSPRRAAANFAAFMVLGGMLFSMLDPSFGVNLNTMVLTFALTISLLILTLAYFVPYMFYMRLKHSERGRLYVVPGSLIVGIFCVILSRALHFQPGFLYGILAGVAYRVELDEDTDGKMIAAAFLFILALSLGSWFALGPVTTAGGAHPAVVMTIFESILACTFMCGIQYAFFAMIPMKFMEGSYILVWSKIAWAAMFGIAAFCFVTILLSPSSGFVSVGTQASVKWVGIACGVLALAAGGLWTWFHFHPEEEAGDGEPAEAGPGAPDDGGARIPALVG